VVPDVVIPDAFLSYMSGDGPSLAVNYADCACANSIHGVRLRKGWSKEALLRRWRNPFTQLSCEVEGHPLGGGMLKVEPREAARIVLADPAQEFSRDELRLIERGVATMKKWRHYG
jgi:hypothetical protein